MNKRLRKALCGAAAAVTLLWTAPAVPRAQEAFEAALQNSIQEANKAIANPTQAPAGARLLTLAQAVTLALANNRDVQLAQTAVTQADAGFKESRAVFRPEVYLGSGLAATKGFPLSIEGSAPSIFNINTSQSLFNPSLKNLEKQAAQMQAAAGRSLEEKRDDIVAQTVLTYLDLDRSRRSVEYLRKHTATVLETQQIVEERVRSGLEPPLEGTKAKLDTARSRSRIVTLQNQIAMLEFALRDMTGISQSEAILTEEAAVPPLAADETMDQLVARALENNQGIRALDEEIRAKEFQVKSEEATRWPRVNLVGQYGLFSDINNFSTYFRKFSRNNVTFGFSVVVPLYARDRISARLSKAGADLAAARIRWNDSRSAIARQVRQIWGEVQEQSGGREVAQLELEVARRSLDVLLAQYEEGRVNRLTVEQARSAEDVSWVNFFQAGYLAEKARLELLRLSGDIRTVFH